MSLGSTFPVCTTSYQCMEEGNTQVNCFCFFSHGLNKVNFHMVGIKLAKIKQISELKCLKISYPHILTRQSLVHSSINTSFPLKWIYQQCFSRGRFSNARSNVSSKCWSLSEENETSEPAQITQQTWQQWINCLSTSVPLSHEQSNKSYTCGPRRGSDHCYIGVRTIQFCTYSVKTHSLRSPRRSFMGFVHIFD